MKRVENKTVLVLSAYALNRKKIKQSLKTMLLVSLIFLTFSSFARERNVLVIHSYHQGLEWTDSISSGILAAFKAYPQYNLYFEYLDTKRNNSDNYLHSIEELYRARSSKIVYDAIITSDNAAYKFMLGHRDELFSEVPVFFCGVNFLNISELLEHKQFYGFEEVANHAGTIDLIRQLFPERKKVLIVNDNTLTGKAIRNELEKVLWQYENILDFEFMESFSIEELQERVALLDQDYVIYLLVVNMDRLGQYISYNRGIKVISEHTTVPIFGSWDFYLNKGIIGGDITRGYEQGQNAAQLAIDYLTGENRNPLAYQKGNTTICLDYSILEKFNLEDSKSTWGVKILNRPVWPLWKIRLLQISIFVLTVLLFSLFIFIYIKNAQKKKLQKLVEVRTRELREANHDLERLNQSKNEILGVVAHDLRNPIGNINGFSNYIIDEDKSNGMLDEESRECIKIINDVSKYMLGLVNNLLDISVIESGVLKLDLKRADYVKFIASEVAHNKAMADGKQMQLKLVKCAEQTWVKFDKIKMQQAFLNILSNAMKYSKVNDVITIELECNKTSVTTKVKDCGPGIPKDKFHTIFGKFAQLDGNSALKNKGAGLGLSIVKGIIEAHQGKVYLESEIGVGTTFIYELPVDGEMEQSVSNQT